MNKKLMDLLGKLINLPIDYVELSCFGVEDPERGKICQICGFPFDKKYREKCVIQTHDQIIELWKPKKKEVEDFLSNYRITGIHPRYHYDNEEWKQVRDYILTQAQKKEG